MKSILYRDLRLPTLLYWIIVILILNTGCKKMSDVTAGTRNNTGTQTEALLSPSGFQAIYLVASDDSYGALHVDPNLKNAWGMANDEGEIWVAAADANLSFVFDKFGSQLMPPVKVAGNPTGTVYNESDDFVIPSTGEPAEFIFAGEDGTISAWNDGTGGFAVPVAKPKHASYKGAAIANDGGENFLYVTNFEKARVDVFDTHFNRVNGKPFRDDNIPEGYAPFGIREIDEALVVTYALRTADGEEDSTGVGLGFVDIYAPNGHLVKRLASHGTLNAPWGIDEAPGSTVSQGHWLLIGNFGDGKINAFDSDGNFRGQLQDQGHDLVIEGLWALDSDIEGISSKQVYFTAGPNDEEDGVFGFITLRP